MIEYAAEIWANRLSVKAVAKTIRRASRQGLLLATAAWKTVSQDALEVLSGIPPMDLIVRDRAELNRFARGETVEVGTQEFDADYETAGQLGSALRKRTLREWNSRWRSTKRPTTRSFFPGIHVRLKAKGTRERDTVAVLAGHGNFGQQLVRIGKNGDEKEFCQDYPGQINSAGHRIRACPHFAVARTALSEAGRRIPAQIWRLARSYCFTIRRRLRLSGNMPGS